MRTKTTSAGSIRKMTVGAAAFSALLCLGAARAQDSRPSSQPTSQPASDDESNPPAPGFNASESDPEAIALVDEVMKALGGRKAWDQTRFITWNFFSRRRHLWDKHQGVDRVEWSNEQGQPIVVVLNLDTRSGEAYVDGQVVGDEARRADLLRSAYGAWVNDSYWLVAPYKLKDAGVTLEYGGEGQTASGTPAEIIQVTFTDDVGLTPENMYQMYFGKESKLLEQWSFFRSSDQESPDFTVPWRNWKRYGKIMLASDYGNLRGMDAKMTDVGVLVSVPDALMRSPRPIDVSELMNHRAPEEPDQSTSQSSRSAQPPRDQAPHASGEAR